MTSEAETPQRAPLYAFLLALIALLAVSAWQWRHGAPVSANLLHLLPSGTHDALVQRAEQRMQEPLNRDVLMLVRHPDLLQASRLSAEIGQAWQRLDLFERVQWSAAGDLDALRSQLLAQRLGLLSTSTREQLIERPDAFVEQRVQQLFDPFASTGLVRPDLDWFGLTLLIQQQLPGTGNLRLGADGTLLAEHDGTTWAVLHARSHSDAFDSHLPLAVSEQVNAARQQVEQVGGELLAMSGLLYAAHGQQQARQESSLIGGLSLVGSLALLLVVFRNWRVLAVVLPILVGALAGTAACVALYGQIHVLTLVLGASLIGVSLDFPLHYLSKSWAIQPWRSNQALRKAFLGLLLALMTNLIGYLALAFTPFPALTQVAIFSAAGLLGAFLCTSCLLPSLLRVPLRPAQRPLQWAHHWLDYRERLLARCATPWLLLGFALFSLAGVAQVNFHDDLRQWVGRDPELGAQAQRIAAITDQQPTSQFFLVRAANIDQLLDRQAELTRRLDTRVAVGELRGYRALSQLVAPLAEQDRLRQALPSLLPASLPLQGLGITTPLLIAELETLQALPPTDLEQALAGPLGEAWRPLWLGTQNGTVAGLVSLQGLTAEADPTHLALDLPGVSLIDRPAELNRLFSATQAQASVLKLLACVLILAMLWLPFGLGGALRCLAVPLLAAWGSLAMLGWLGQSLTLFGLFGLLLVTAIGVDYAILLREQVGGAAVSLLGTLLSAVTTWLSFGLLALSGTPAVSNFGLAVSLGLIFAFLFAPWAAKPREVSEA